MADAIFKPKNRKRVVNFEGRVSVVENEKIVLEDV